jgi:hypothetical protein
MMLIEKIPHLLMGLLLTTYFFQLLYILRWKKENNLIHLFSLITLAYIFITQGMFIFGVVSIIAFFQSFDNQTLFNSKEKMRKVIYFFLFLTFVIIFYEINSIVHWRFKEDSLSIILSLIIFWTAVKLKEDLISAYLVITMLFFMLYLCFTPNLKADLLYFIPVVIALTVSRIYYRIPPDFD